MGNSYTGISEKEFQQQVIDLAKLRGYEFVYHTWSSKHSPTGFPDLIMLKGKKMIVAELKVGKNQLSAEQYFWLCAFGEITKNVFVWYPEDWDEIIGRVI